MAIQIDYFPAATDDEAAATAKLEDGLRGQYEDAAPIDPDAPLALSQDVDPGLGLGYLYGILTHTDLDTYLDEFSPELITVSSDEQKYVLAVDDRVIERLAAGIDTVDDTVSAWADVSAPAAADEWNPRIRDLREFLDSFIALAQFARDNGQRVYCWLWP